jgi:hypothetical protein
MQRSIDVDDEVYAALQRSAEAFIDTPNSVLRRVLGIDKNGSERPLAADLTSNAIDPIAVAKRVAAQRRSASKTPSPAARAAGARAAKAPRAKRGTLLPESEYEIPILLYLDEHGGRAPSREVVDAVGEVLADRLTDEDKQELRSGDVRWKNRAAFVRLRLIEKQELSGEAPRGTWEITDKGRERLRSDA